MQTVKGFFGALRMTKGNDVEIDNPSTAQENPKPTKERLEDPCGPPPLLQRRLRECKMQNYVGASIARPLGKTKLTQRVILREAKDLL